jgi:hypothetical protein
MIARGAAETSLDKVARIGRYAAYLVLGGVSYGTIQDKKQQSEIEKIEFDKKQMKSRLELEKYFPEPEVNIALDVCREAVESIAQATSNRLKIFWTSSAKKKCDIFMTRAQYALKILEKNDYTRCHPGNSGAYERINTKLQNLVEYWPELSAQNLN